MRTLRNEMAITLYLLAMLFTNGWVVWELRQPILQGYGDFAAFYTAGKLLQEGDAASLYDATAQWRVQQEFAPSVDIRRGPLPYVRPAFEALLFLPFAYLSYQGALLCWSLINGALLFASCHILTASVERPLFPTAIATGLLLAFFPFGLNFLQGQDAIVLLFIFSVVYRLLTKDATFAAGCIMALGLFKFHLVLPIALICLLRRQVRLLVGFLVVAVAELLASIALVGFSGVWNYPKYLLGTALDAGTGMTTWYNMPNLRAVLTGVSGRSIPLWLALLLSLTAAALVAWLWGRAEHKSTRSLAVPFSLAIATAVLTSYYAYSHDLVLLAIPLLLLQNSILQNDVLSGGQRILYLASVALLTLTPLYWFLLLRTTYLFWLGSASLLLMVIALAWTARAEASQLRS